MNADAECLNDKMEEAWKQLREELFCEETGLIYDSISSHEHEHRFEHLPLVDEIQSAVPNPHGYATGMEDCVLNAGFAIEICVHRAKREALREQSADFARRLYRGMIRCATIHGRKGYVVRGISPRDNRSVYIESSRDQFTLFVFGVWRYYHSSFATDEEKREIREALADVAGFAEARMRENFDYNLGRLDGSPAMHLKMIGVNPHEAMRLPMFFAAAFDVTGRKEFWQLYEKYVSRGLADSLRFSERKSPWWHIELSQMQFSLALCRAVDSCAERLRSMDELMIMVAKVARSQAMSGDFPRLRKYSGNWRPLAHSWRNAERFTVTRFENGNTSLYGGRLYLKGEEPEDFRNVFETIRSVGNLTVSVMLTEIYNAGKEFVDEFVRSVVVPDYRHHTSAALVNILCAYFLVAGIIDRQTGRSCSMGATRAPILRR
ncbi:hypothetical protein OpiT1DRAFT_01985 [Opitutaceae bacterium TAV1]|nr:hypothetical protein OpiT1DRAFT_01985 [Opitutaceae bacterium TAV1]